MAQQKPRIDAEETVTARVENGMMEYVPTWRERAWRRLGFRYHLGDEPPEVDGLPGWMCTETRMRFGAADRVRLLLTGRLHIRLVQYLPVQCDYAKSRLDYQINAPGERT
jgi:hypothetical protein